MKIPSEPLRFFRTHCYIAAFSVAVMCVWEGVGGSTKVLTQPLRVCCTLCYTMTLFCRKMPYSAFSIHKFCLFLGSLCQM